MTKAKLVKAPKLPKSLGACVDLLHDKREERLAANRHTEALKVAENAIKDHIVDNVSKGEDRGAVGKRFKGVVTTEDVFQVDDWDVFYAHLKKTGEFDLLNRALNQAAVKERVAMQEPPKTEAARKKWKPKLPPGIKTIKVVKLSITKV